MSINNFNDISEFQLCCGCGVCAYLYPDDIQMIDVPNFGRRPLMKNKTNYQANLLDIKKICPGIELSNELNVSRRSEIINSLLNAWGPILELWEGYAADPEIRFKGSSGGAMSALALYCLDQENMYGVLHTNADNLNPHLNKTTMSKNREDILAAAGSRYSPASPCEKLQEIEKASVPSVFIGKPCDVAAVQKVRKIKPELDKKVGLTIACFCAGTPSTNGTREMLKQMGVSDLEKLNDLRYRGCGWPGMTTASQNTNDGLEQTEITYQQSWGEILQKYRQWRCYICPDHTGEFADIAVGDPWYREIEDGDNGRSLVLARSPKGREIINKAITAGYLVAKKVDPAILPASQPNLMKARGALWGRLMTLKLMMAPYPEYGNMPMFPFWMTELSIKEKTQTFYGTMKRIFTKGLRKRHKQSARLRENS